MKFCLLTTFFPPQHFGGDAIMVSHLANALAGDGHHVEVVHCADAFNLLRGHVAPSRVELDPRIRVHTLESPFGALSPILTYATGLPLLKTPRLRSILARDFDVVHWHNLSLVGGPGALRLGKGVRLYTLHEYWLMCPTHILFKNNEEACTEKECFGCTLRHHRIPQPWRAGGWLKRTLHRDIDKFLVPSRFVQEQLRTAGLGVDSVVIPNFVQPRPRVAPADTHDGYYLYVGRLEKAKGVQTLLPLFKKTGRKLVIAGSGEFERELRAQASGVPGVQFLGRVPFAELPAWYAGARATLVPSLCYETFGLTVLESLQQGTPVITSRFGALPEIVSSTGGGETYGSAAELESILDRFDQNPAYRRTLGENGFRSLPRFSLRAHLDQYFEVIDDVHRSRGLKKMQNA